MPSPLAFVAATATASAVTPVAAAPTTASHFSLFNGDPIKSMTVTSLACSTQGTSAAAAENLQLLAHMSVAMLKGIPTGGTAAQGPKPLGSGAAAGSNGVAVSTVTIVQDGIWHPVGWSANSGAGTATIALGTWTNLINTFGQPLYVIPPGGMLSLAVLSSTAAGKCVCSVTWTEQ